MIIQYINVNVSTYLYKLLLFLYIYIKIEKPFSHIEEYIRIGGSPIDFANNKYLKCIVIGFGIINAEHEGFIKQIMVKHGRKACEGYDR